VTLPKGIVIPKGAELAVSNEIMRSPDSPIYHDPDQFDGHRFYKLRQVSGQEHWTQFASTSLEHFAFGYGKHACPGRVFVSNMVKIFMCHMLLKYDFKLPSESHPSPLLLGIGILANPFAHILIRRRKEEIAL
jgi:cytochrome P450